MTTAVAREHWSSRLGFILAAIGSTIGLGLLWKFPYVIGENGGGAFLLTYFCCLFLVGIPLFMGELLLGKVTQRSAIGAFSEAAPHRGMWLSGGVLGVLASFLIMSFYSVIAGWGMSYILMSLNGFYYGMTPVEIGRIYQKLSSSSAITLLWHFLFTAITMGIVMSGVRQGIEFWSRIMVRILLIILVALFCYSMTLSGFGKAVDFIFVPDWSSFTMSSALEALGLAFMTMSLGQGIMISYGSYMSPSENVTSMSFIVAGSVLIVAILAALTIFPVVFTFGFDPQAGPGLVFQTLPYLFSRLPGAMILSTLFFVLFVFTALTSAIPLIEVVATNLMERYGLSRRVAVIGVSCATFIFGLPSAFAYSGALFPEWVDIFGHTFMDTVNDLVSIWVIPLTGLITSLFIGWVMDRQVLSEQFAHEGVSGWIEGIWWLFIRWISPALIFVILLEKSGLIGS